MSGDPDLARRYADALADYAKDVSTMALAATCGSADDHARAALRAAATWQNDVQPARAAWQETCPVDYEPSTDQKG